MQWLRLHDIGRKCGLREVGHWVTRVSRRPTTMLFHLIHPAHETNPFVKACFPFCTVSPITLRPGKEDVGLTSSFTMTGNISAELFNCRGGH